MNKKIKGVGKVSSLEDELYDALLSLMEAEGGEPGETKLQKTAWKKAVKVVRKYRTLVDTKNGGNNERHSRKRCY